MVNLAVVACGDRVAETITLVKSALMFTRSYLQFFIITEPKLKHDFIQQVNFKKYSNWLFYVSLDFL